MSFIGKTGFAVAVVAASSIAAAQGYVGASIGQSSTKFNTTDYSLGLATVSESQDKTDSAYKLFVGYDLNKAWAIEGGYVDFGKAKYMYAGTGALAGLTGQADIKNSAWFIAGKGTIAINEQFGLFGKLGISSNKSKLSGTTNNAAVNAAAGFPMTASKTRTDLVYGVGAEYSVTKQVALRFEFEDFGKFGNDNDTGRTKASMWSLGLGYKF
jgi:OOP family OmpA-OmpF porin